MSLSCFQLQDKDLAARLVFHKREVRRTEKQMREKHIERLVQGQKDSITTSAIHLDVLSEYRRVIGLITNHAIAFLKMTSIWLRANLNLY